VVRFESEFLVCQIDDYCSASCSCVDARQDEIAGAESTGADVLAAAKSRDGAAEWCGDALSSSSLVYQ
jgi:hypothetical protein